MKRVLLLFTAILLCFVFFTSSADAQTTGTMFRDFNGNGTRQNTAGTFVEPVVQGIIVNAYNSSDALIASYASSSAGTFSIPLTGSTYTELRFDLSLSLLPLVD